MLRSFTGSAQGVHEASHEGRTKGERRPRGSARRHGRRGRKEDEDAKKGAPRSSTAPERLQE